MILVYIGVGGAEMVEAWREQRLLWSAACTLGPILLLWVLYRNIYPVPEFPNNLWPYVALVWVLVSWGLMRLRPGVSPARLCPTICDREFEAGWPFCSADAKMAHACRSCRVASVTGDKRMKFACSRVLLAAGAVLFAALGSPPRKMTSIRARKCSLQSPIPRPNLRRRTRGGCS